MDDLRFLPIKKRPIKQNEEFKLNGNESGPSNPKCTNVTENPSASTTAKESNQENRKERKRIANRKCKQKTRAQFYKAERKRSGVEVKILPHAKTIILQNKEVDLIERNAKEAELAAIHLLSAANRHKS